MTTVTRAMPKACANCPFVAAAKGQDYLRPGRLDGIKLATAMGRSFHCHKTTGVTDDGRDSDPRRLRQCRGALDWLERFAAEHDIPVTRIEP